MADKITRETPIAELTASDRLKNRLRRLANTHFERGKVPTVKQFLSLSDTELMKLPDFGLISLKEWKELTAHLREDYYEKESNAEYRALKKIRTSIKTISGVHRNLARLYEELAEIILPFDKA
jgi:DNA-directed RNA polymerase alpha subunit